MLIHKSENASVLVCVADVTESTSNCPCNGEEWPENVKNIFTPCIQRPAGSKGTCSGFVQMTGLDFWASDHGFHMLQLLIALNIVDLG